MKNEKLKLGKTKEGEEFSQFFIFHSSVFFLIIPARRHVITTSPR